MSRFRRGLVVPTYVLVLLVLGLAFLFLQGLRMAHDRQQRMLPGRVEVALIAGADEEVEVTFGPDSRFILVDLPEEAGARLGLHQVFPERTLVRWIEDPTSPPGSGLVIPLEGLESGHYVLTREAPNAVAGPREMDRPREDLRVLARFHLVPRHPGGG